jgi:hypothetical protein
MPRCEMLTAIIDVYVAACVCVCFTVATAEDTPPSRRVIGASERLYPGPSKANNTTAVTAPGPQTGNISCATLFMCNEHMFMCKGDAQY